MACQCLASAPAALQPRASSRIARKPLLATSQVRSLGSTGVLAQTHGLQQRFQSCPLPSTKFRASFGRARPQRRGQTSIQAYNKSPDITERALSAAPYLIPLCDGLRYGKFFFAQFPQFSVVLAPLNPIISLYFGIPFASVAVFFAVYLGIINNQKFSRWCRFNALQAVLLDIILILPGLFENIIKPPMSGPGLQIYVSLYNSIWLFVFACVAYGVGSCVTGQTPRLPIVADAAEQQLR